MVRPIRPVSCWTRPRSRQSSWLADYDRYRLRYVSAVLSYGGELWPTVETAAPADRVPDRPAYVSRRTTAYSQNYLPLHPRTTLGNAQRGGFVPSASWRNFPAKRMSAPPPSIFPSNYLWRRRLAIPTDTHVPLPDRFQCSVAK